ncbi:MAG: hypothetical protein CBD27_11690 [Rhodospirillaceae bacterium TMED167]|nr:2OG-Fe(II) oxygenase [Rhodospirillaceae bacterium]OUW24041.1 MAG: hypothetical protein CBD27_11690 [Rhodospirillaceae bacterium TMED167]
MSVKPVRHANPEEIPVIDISDLDAGNRDARAGVSADIVSAAENTGFFYVVNHGVSGALVENLLRLSASFFDEAEADKLTLGLRNSACFRGYLPLDSRGSDPKLRRYLEAFQIGEEHEPEGAQEAMMYGPNQWPEKPAELRSVMSAYHREMRALSDRLQKAFALGIGFDEEFFLQFYQKPLNQLRLLHYPPQPEDADEGVIGAQAHTDAAAFTILLQDQNGGLEVETPSGEWVSATPLRESLVVNIGDFLRNWTNGRFLSVKHRVVNHTRSDRYSIPYFLDPDLSTVVAPLDIFTSDINPPRFEPLHTGKYLCERFDSIWPRMDV